MVHHGMEERGEEGGSEKAKADLLYPLRPAFPLGERRQTQMGARTNLHKGEENTFTPSVSDE